MKLTLLLVTLLSVLSLTWALPLEEADEEAALAPVIEDEADLEGAESHYYPSYNYRPRYYHKPRYYYKPRYYEPRRRYSYSHW